MSNVQWRAFSNTSYLMVMKRHTLSNYRTFLITLALFNHSDYYVHTRCSHADTKCHLPYRIAMNHYPRIGFDWNTLTLSAHWTGSSVLYIHFALRFLHELNFYTNFSSRQFWTDFSFIRRNFSFFGNILFLRKKFLSTERMFFRKTFLLFEKKKKGE